MKFKAITWRTRSASSVFMFGVDKSGRGAGRASSFAIFRCTLILIVRVLPNGILIIIVIASPLCTI
jgi:hypothetical protein